MKYAVNEEGISAMNAMASAIEEAVEEIQSQCKKIESAADEHQDSIGPHQASLESVLEEIATNLSQSSEPANLVGEKLKEVAEGYQEVIDTDNFRSSI